MKNFDKYKKNYFLPPYECENWIIKDYIHTPPKWCSVDLRDGNQALIVPMNLEEKLKFFKLLVDIGFKEIEVGFPAASDTEYSFLRALIERNLIPDDVTIQVLTQSREHIIKKTFESLKGVKKAIVHLYNSTSLAQREQVFKRSNGEIIDIAVNGAKLLKDLAGKTSSDIKFEYSPESFTGTEMEFARDICNNVLDVLMPSENNKVIINLPVTVELSMPHVYASQVEYMCNELKYKEDVVVSVHPHNDRGGAVTSAELGVLAGAERVEGSLFGNGERTGNMDIITMALNMYSHGVDPKLNFEKLPEIIKIYETITGNKVYERQPYSGELVFAAFSGSHQDAIAKGLKYRKENNLASWNIPYLPIDPSDIGRNYDEDIIRINSQSGKGGIGFILSNKFGFETPKDMLADIIHTIKNISDEKRKELTPNEIYDIFKSTYVNFEYKLKLMDYHFTRDSDSFAVSLSVIFNGKDMNLNSRGNGRLDAVSNALKEELGLNYTLFEYKEHALDQGSTSRAMAYVGINRGDNTSYWGAGIDADIVLSSIKALFSAVSRMLSQN